MIRLGVVGFGGFGWSLLKNLDEASAALDCRVVAASDLRLASLSGKAETLRQRNVQLFDDAQKMFDALRGRLDAVYIASSIPTHTELAVAAAEAGYHIHLEKPPAATIQEVDRIADAVDRAGVICLVGFQAVHGNDCRFLKERIVAGRLGHIQWLTCRAGWPRPASYYARNEWAGRLRAGDRWVLDGPATNALSHQVNNLLHLADERAGGYAAPTTVRAELYAARNESHDLAAMEIQTDRGVPIHCMLTHCPESFYGPIITVQGTAGRAEWTIYGEAQITYADGTTEHCADGRDDTDEMIVNFISAVRSGDGASMRCALADARKMVLALNVAHESSGRIHPVAPGDIRVEPEGEGDQRTEVRGLDDLVLRATEQRCLFSDLDERPDWIVATQAFDTAGYDHFPQRFSCD